MTLEYLLDKTAKALNIFAHNKCKELSLLQVEEVIENIAKLRELCAKGIIIIRYSKGKNQYLIENGTKIVFHTIYKDTLSILKELENLRESKHQTIKLSELLNTEINELLK